MRLSSAIKLLVAALCAIPLRTCARFCAPLRRFIHWQRLRARLGDLPPSVVLHGMPDLHGSANIKLGQNLLLYRDVHLETQHHGSISVGDGCVFSRGVHLVAFERIEIGAGTMIGEYASVRDANHVYTQTGIALRDAGHSASPISIGREVWIGRGAAILAGVTIGDGAVIGANAVVTHNVAAGEVVGGVPARTLNRKKSPAP